MFHGRRFGVVLLLVLAALTGNNLGAGDPQLLQVAKLVPFVDLFEDAVYFGNAVAMDGDLMVVGARQEDALDLGSGAAYVFVRADGDWYLQAKLVPSDGAAYDEFGWSVAIDGLTVVVGARLRQRPAGQQPGSGLRLLPVPPTANGPSRTGLRRSTVAPNENFGNSVAVRRRHRAGWSPEAQRHCIPRRRGLRLCPIRTGIGPSNRSSSPTISSPPTCSAIPWRSRATPP